MDFIIKSFTPEIFFSFCLLYQLVINSYLSNSVLYNFPILYKEIFGQISFIFLCTLLLFINIKIEGFFTNFLFVNDISNYYLKQCLILISLFMLSSLIRCFVFQQLNIIEFFSIFLLSILASLLLLSASDMISVYLVFELQALAFYILASFQRTSAISAEAGLKYFIIGSFISSIFLLGCSLIYLVLGTLNFMHIRLLLSFPLTFDLYLYLIIGFLLVLVTLCFKLAVVPFHFWAPDVYEGSPLASTIIFALLPKLVLLSFFIKLLSLLQMNFTHLFSLLQILGFLTVFVGSCFAFYQKRVKRFIIYSSIAQLGFLIISLSIYNFNSLVSLFFFLFIYLITSLVLWSNVSLFYNFKIKVFHFNEYYFNCLFLVNFSNFFKLNKIWSFSFIILMFSLAGIPPFSGFLAKLLIIVNMLESVDTSILFICLLFLVTAFSTFYYLQILKIFFFEKPNNLLISQDFLPVLDTPFCFFDYSIISLGLFSLFFFFIFPNTMLLFCQSIVLNFFFL